MAGQGISAATRSVIWNRDRYECRRCHYTGDQIHHRHPRGMGGTNRWWVNAPANLVLLCWRCHQWIELHRRQAEAQGWLVREGTDPKTVPIKTIWGQLLLDNEGRVTKLESVAVW